LNYLAEFKERFLAAIVAVNLSVLVGDEQITLNQFLDM
jgi:hypothetical protein